MAGYEPGFQPENPNVVKLNTNENPYPASLKVLAALKNITLEQVRKYPQPMGDTFREAASKILGVKSAQELGEVAAAVGLVQNLAALRSLVTEGIQKGHMVLHARNVAISAGAAGEAAGQIANQMIREGRIGFD